MNLIFDIGCNIGEFTRACYHKYPDCKVVAVDANEDVLKLLPREESLVKLNKLVGNNTGDVKFYIDTYQTGVSTASEKWMAESRFSKGSKYLPEQSVRWNKTVVPEGTTLDDLVAAYGKPDYIKIDVEGFEYEVVSGLSEKQNTLCFEWVEEDPESLEKTIEHLQDIGYQDFGIVGYFDENIENLIYCDHSDQGDPYLQEPETFTDWEFLRQELASVCDPHRRVNYGMAFAK